MLKHDLTEYQSSLIIYFEFSGTKVNNQSHECEPDQL